MIFIFVAVFIITLLLNWYIIIFGKKDLQQLKSKLSIGKYLSEIEEAIDNELGHNTTTIIKLSLIAVSILIIIFNLFGFLLGLLGFVFGTFAAKKSYQIPSFNNWLNKIALYINRLR